MVKNLRRTLYCWNKSNLLALILMLGGVGLSGGEMWGQSGPGGIGDPDHWLRADAGNDGLTPTPTGPVTETLAAASTWNNQGTAAASNATLTGTADYILPLINFNEAIRIPLTSYYEHPTPADQDFTISLVMQTTQTGSGGNPLVQPAIYTNGSGSAGNAFYLTMTGGTINFHVEATTSATVTSAASTYNDGRPYLITIDRDNSTGEIRMFIDGTQQGTAQTASSGVSLNQNANTRIGASFATSPTGDWEGDVAEIIVHSSVLSATERQRLETDLAIKYGIPLSNSYRSFDDSNIYNVASFDNDIFGITDQANSNGSYIQIFSTPRDGGGGLTVYNSDAYASFPTEMYSAIASPPGNAFNVNDDEYVLIGHDGGTLGFTDTIADSHVQLYGRKYKIEDYNGIGVNTLRFNGSVFTDLVSASTFDYAVIVSADQTINLEDDIFFLTDQGGNIFTAEINFDDDVVDFFALARFPKPGGVATRPHIWLEGDQSHDQVGVAGTNNIGGGGDNWIDQSGSATGADEDNNSQAVENGMNYRQIVSVDGNGSYQLDELVGDDITAIFVLRTNENGTAGSVWDEPAILGGEIGGQDDYYLSMSNGNIRWTTDPNGGGGATITTAGTYDDNIPHIVVARREASSGNIALYIEGDSITGGNGGTGTLARGGTNARIRIGEEPDGDGDWDGDFAEVILYNDLLNLNELRRVETMLAIKYGITLQHDYIDEDGTTVLYALDATYDNDIMGLGRSSAAGGAWEQKQTFSATDSASLFVFSGVGYSGTYPATNVDNDSSLAEGQYLIMGHNNQAATFTGTFLVPNIISERHYKVTNTGGVDSVTLAFDPARFTDLTLAQPAGTYELIVSTDNTFDPGDTRVPLTEQGSGLFDVTYRFPTGTSYFTIMLAPPNINPEGLEVWFRADSGSNCVVASPVAGCIPTVWRDQSDNSQDALVSPFITYQIPQFNYNEVMNVPASDFFEFPDSAFDDMTIMMAMRTTETGIGGSYTAQPAIFTNGDGSGTEAAFYFTMNGGILNWTVSDGTVPGTSTAVSGSPYNNGEIYIITLTRNATTGDIEINVNGNQDGAVAGATTVPLNISGLARIGSNLTGGQGFEGEIAEFLVFDSLLTGNDILEYESALAIKYGVTLANNYRVGGNVEYTISGYDRDIIGLASDTVASLLFTQRQSFPQNFPNTLEIYKGYGYNGSYPATQYQTVGSPSNTDIPDGAYIIMGHDGGSQSFSATPLANNNLIDVYEQHWKVEDVNGMDSITLFLNGAGIPGLVSGNEYGLIISDNNATFDGDDEIIPLVDLNLNRFAAEYDFADNITSYFTIVQLVDPAGASTADLHLWLRADAGHDRVGTAGVSGLTGLTNEWLDQGPNSTGANESGDADLALPSLNFEHGIDIDPNDLMEFEELDGGDMSIFIVFQSTEAGNGTDPWNEPAIFSAENNAGDLDYFITMDDGVLKWSVDGTSGGFDQVVTPNDFYNNGVPYLITARRDQSTGEIQLFVDGASIGTATGDTDLLDRSGGGGAGDNLISIGDQADGGGGQFDGIYGEVVAFNADLGATVREQIETMLAIKNGISLGHDYRDYLGNIIYTPSPLIGTYDQDIFGIGAIGREGGDWSQLQSRPAQDTNSLTIYHGEHAGTTYPANNTLNPDAITDGNYLIIGHDDGDTTFTNAFNGLTGRLLGRTYQATNTGTPGITDSVTLVFDNATFIQLDPNGTYELIYSNDETFTTADTRYPLVHRGSGIFDCNVLFNSGTDFFSIVNMTPAPGGVANGIHVWLRPDSGHVGVGVAQTAIGPGTPDWEDQSGNGNDGTQNNGVLGGYLGTTSLLNYHETISTDGNDDEVRFNPLDGDDMSIFVVVNSTDNAAHTGNYASDLAVYSGDRGAAGDDYYITMGGGEFAFVVVNNALTVDEILLSGAGNDDGNNHIVNGTRAGVGGAMFLYTEGIQRDNGSGPTGTLDWNGTGGYINAIGRHDDNDGEFDADYGDVIAYNAVLSQTEREQVNTYLALKYGVTVDHDLLNSDGLVIFGNDAYSNEVFGIGRDDFSALNQKQSTPTTARDSIVLYNGPIDLNSTAAPANNVANAATFADSSWVIIGHDNAATAFNSPYAGNPSGRLDRIWKVEESGSVDSVTIDFDGATYMLNNTNDYDLLIGTDPTFASATTVRIVDYSSGTRFYAKADFVANDTSYFTIVERAETVSPAGVDSLNLVTWLRADFGVSGSTNCTPVTAAGACDIGGPGATDGSWLDQSPGPLPASEELANSQLISPSANFKSAVNLGVNSAFETSRSADQDISIVMVFANNNAFSSASFENQMPLLSAANDGGAQDYYLTMGGDSVHWTTSDGTERTVSAGAVDYSDGAPHIVFAERQLTGTSQQILLDGSDGQTGTSATGALNGYFFGTLTMGQHPPEVTGNAPVTRSTQELYEVLVFNDILTTLERDQIQTMLAIKYGIPLPGDYVSHTGATIYSDLTYNQDVIGLANTDVDGGLYTQSASTPRSNPNGFVVVAGAGQNGVIPTLNDILPTAVPQNAYLLTGHDGASTGFNGTLFTANDLMERVYKVETENTPGTVTLFFNTTEFPSLATTGFAYSLIVGGSPTIQTSDPQAVLTDHGGGLFSVEYDFGTNSDMYFTIVREAFVEPGGVDASNLRVWYKGDTGLAPCTTTPTTANCQVGGAGTGNGTWVNQSPFKNTYDASEISGEIVYRTDTVNFRGVVDIQPNAGFDVPYTPAGDVSMFVVFESFSPTGTVINSVDGTGDFELSLNGGNLRWETQGATGPTESVAATYANGDAYMVYASRDVATLTAGQFLAIDGLSSTATITTQQNSTVDPFTAGNFVIGEERNGTDGGDIRVAEFLMYDVVLGDTQRQQVETMLSIKYGIPFQQDYLSHNGNIIFDRVAPYLSNIVGIGAAPRGGGLWTQKQSRGREEPGGLTIYNGTHATLPADNYLNTSTMNLNSYLIAGSNNLDGNYISSYAGVDSVLTERSYRVTDSGSVDTVTLAFTTTIFPGIVADDSLIVSSDPVFDPSDTRIPLVDRGGGVLTAEYDFPDGTSYFAILQQGVSIDLVIPGNVSGPIELWLRADAGTDCITNNCGVSTWADFSFTGRNATTATASGSVALVHGAMNFNPSVLIDESYMSLNNVSAEEMDIFAVINTGEIDPSSGDWRSAPAIFNAAPDGQSNVYGLGIDNGEIVFGERSPIAGNAIRSNSPSGAVPLAYNNNTNVLLNISRTTSTGTFNTRFLLNGLQEDIGSTGVDPLSDATELWLGAYRDNLQAPVLDYTGNYGDVIVFPRQLTQTEREQVNTYLALKYGIPLTHDYRNGQGTVIYNVSVYDQDVIGIGRADSTGLYQLQSQPAYNPDGLTIYKGRDYDDAFPSFNIVGDSETNPDTLADESYLIMGHNGGAGGSFSATFGPYTNTLDARSYQVVNIGVDTVTLEFNDTEFTGLVPGTDRTYYMLVSSDQTFDATDLFIPLQILPTTPTGGYYVEYNFPPDTSYFSLVAMPHPVADLWYRADSSVTTSGSDVQVWGDISSNANNSHPVTSNAGTVTQNFSSMNFNPTISIAAGGNIDFPDSVNRRDIADDDFSVFLVTRTTQTPANGAGNWFTQSAVLSKEAVGTDDWGLAMDDNGDLYVGINNDTTLSPSLTNATLNDGTPHLVTLIRDRNDSTGLGQPNTSFLLFDGDNKSSLALPGNNNYLANSDTFSIGQHSNLGTGQYIGDYGEIMIFDNRLKNGDQNAIRRIETYLATKYGITLDDDYYGQAGVSVFTRDQLANGTYDLDIFGIGRDDQFGLDQRQSASQNAADLVRIYNGTGYAGTFPTSNVVGPDSNANGFGSDNSYLIIGRSSSGADNYTTSTLQNTGEQRWGRTWYAENNGAVGTVTLYFPAATYNFAVSGDYGVIVGNSGATFDGSVAANRYPMERMPNNDRYVEVPLNATNPFFTIYREFPPRPGNVADASNPTALWLNPDTFAVTTGSTGELANWYDISLGGNDATPSAPASGDTVRLATGRMNYNNSVQVQNTFLSFNTPQTADLTVISVFRSTQGAPGGNWRAEPAIVSFEQNNSNPVLGITMDGGDVTGALSNNATGAGAVITSNGFNYANDNPNFAIYARDPNTIFDEEELYVNGVTTGTTTNGNNGNLVAATGQLGQHLDGDGQFVGEYGDVIVLDRRITGTDLDRINTYLALKYGLTLPLDSQYVDLYNPTNIVYDGNSGALGNFDQEIVGVSRSDSSLLHQRISSPPITGVDVPLTIIHGTGHAASGVVPSLNDTLLDLTNDNTYAIMGHDGDTVALGLDFNSVPSTRMQRIYKMEETGTVGTVSLFFDNDHFPSLVAGNSYFLIYRQADTAFAISDPQVPLVPVDSGYIAEVNFLSGTTYFTVFENTVIGPGGVQTGIQIWYKGDVPYEPTPNIWRDQSGNANHALDASNSILNSSLATNQYLNFNNYLISPDTLERDFGSQSVTSGNTIFIVGSGQKTSTTTRGGYIGYEDPSTTASYGLISLTTGPTIDNSTNSNFSSGGILRQDGVTLAAGNNPSVGNFSIVSAQIDPLGTVPNPFSIGALLYLGGYTSATDESMDSYEFAEVVAYNGALKTQTEIEKVETYLAIKYGLTLQTDYLSAIDSIGTVYPVGGHSYNNAIAGLARQDTSGFQQRQSKSHFGNDIVLMALEDLEPEGTPNTNLFDNDEFYLIWGHEGGSLCWAAEDFSIGPDSNHYVRLEREWRMETTNGTGSSDIIEVVILGASLPTTLPGGDSLLLVFSPDSNFTNTALSIPLIDTLGGDTLFAEIDASVYNNYNYFTVASYLDDPRWHQVDYCEGDLAVWYGSRLLDVGSNCTRISISNADTTHFIYNRGVVGAPGNNEFFGAASGFANNPGACLDSIVWSVPAGLASFDTFVVNVDFDTVTTSAPCGVGGNYDVSSPYVLLDSITIGLTGTSNFNYQDVTCLGDSNQLPVQLGPSFLDGRYFVTDTFQGQEIVTPGLLFNENTGEISINTSVVDTHYIAFTPLGYCPTGDTTYDSLIIELPVPSYVAFDTNTICELETNIVLLDSTRPVLGVVQPSNFRVSPSTGLVFNTTLAGIDPAASQPGLYTITYVPNDSICNLPSDTTITIEPAERGEFEYTSNEFCQFGPNPFPTPINVPNTNWFYRSSVPANCVVDSVTGEIDLTLSFIGSYEIYLLPDSNISPCAVADTFAITIHPLPDPDFNLDSTYCFNGVGIAFDTLFGTAGIPVGGSAFFTSPSSFLTIDSTSAGASAANPYVSGNTAGGPFPVQYNVTNTFGCSDSLVRVTRLIGIPVSSIVYPDEITAGVYEYCDDDVDIAPVFLTGVTGGFFSTGGTTLPVDSTTGIIGLSTLNGFAQDSVFYTKDTLGCTSTFSIGQVTVGGFLDATITLTGDSVCPGTSLPITSASIFNYSILDSGNVVAGPFTTGPINTATLNPNTHYTVRNVTASGLGTSTVCRDTALNYFFIHLADSALFAYQDSIVCNTEGDVNPLLFGTTGGFFTADTNAVNLDSITGEITVDTTVTGAFQITYTTVGVCPDTSTYNIQILEGASSEFTYPQSEVCTDVGLLVATVDNPNGTFTCPDCPQGALQSNGDLQLAAFLSDTTVTVTYLVSAGNAACESQVSRTVTVDNEITGLTISYPEPFYCPDQIATPIISDTSESGTFDNVNLIVIDQNTGVVNPAFAAARDTFTITYVLNTICAEEATTELILLPQLDASFEFNPTDYCFGDLDTIAPTTLADQTGTFSITNRPTGTSQFPIADSSLGLFLLTGADEGTYEVTHIVPGNCPDTVAQDITLNEQVFIGDVTVDPGYQICGDSILTVSINPSIAGTPTFFLNGVPQLTNFPIYTETNLVDSMFINITYQATSGCQTDTTILVTEKLKPDGAPRTFPQTITGDQPVEIIMESYTDNTNFIWTATALPTNIITLDSTSGETELIGIGETATISGIATLESDIDPSTIEYIITPLRDSCPGDPDTLLILVNPNGEAIFVPGVFTPNGDFSNETWQIQWNESIVPTDYTIYIYNRTGGLVKTMEELNNTWDGENLPDGVYWYLINDAAGEFVKAGGLTIRRQ